MQHPVARARLSAGRFGVAGMYRGLCATVCTLALSASGFADDAPGSGGPDAQWYVCDAPEHCAWTIGEGGWPVAVRTESVQAYREWVRSRAPFTTYFAPGDCFMSDDAFQAYARESKSRVMCAGRRCALAIEPHCTK